MLAGVFEILPILTESPAVFGDTASYALSPESEARGLEVLAHRGNHLLLTETRASAYFLKARAVFPCHTNDRVCELLKWHILYSGRG